MTIQVAVMNGYGVAMASDRHVFRGGDARSTGQDIKLRRLRTRVPAAMMSSGPFAVFGLPVSRLALRLERALDAAGPGPDTLAEAVLAALEQPLDGPMQSDSEILAEVTDHVLTRALEAGASPEDGLARVLAELAASAPCRNGPALEASVRAAWDGARPSLGARLSRPEMASALHAAPELCGRAVAGALSRDWRRSADLFLTIGMCCPETGVPALLSLRMWKGVGNRLQLASRLEKDYEAAWRAGRTVIVAQGSGRPLVEAMIDGLSDEHWSKLPALGRDTLRGGMNARWDSAHQRLGVSSPKELGAVVSGLVRGAEVIGFLTREGESSVLEVDCMVITPQGVAGDKLGSGPDTSLSA